MAGAVGLHRVTASRAITKTAASSALPARHLSTLPAGAASTNDGKIVGVVEGKFDAKTQQITILKSSSSDLKSVFKAFGRSDANTVLPDSSHTKAFTRSCANPNGSGNSAVNCLSTAPVNTVSGEMKITNTGTRKFYNTRLVFTDFLDQRGGIP